MSNAARNDRLDRLRRRERVAVLVVGGGINGISVYRELALQDVDVILVERGDFMSGASAAPSRMIHGGLRYMENGEFDLVRESLGERNRLLGNAPHYVSPLPTVIPIGDRFSGMFAAVRRMLGGNPKPGARGSLIVRIGLTLYDLYAGRANPLPRHHMSGRRETRRLWPALSRRFNTVATYHDAKISYPERLGVEMVMDVDGRCGNALALNHVAFAGADAGAVTLKDALTGESFRLRADVIVNATGAWVDLTNALLADRPGRMIGGTKGSHLVLHSPALVAALGENMVYFANADGRVCILYVHFGNVLAGSTDISVDTPDDVRCEPDETAYILQSIRQIFPSIDLGPADIVYRFSGVRPLPLSNVGVNAEISRDHRCEWTDAAGGVPVLHLIGGKWTTFRAFGEQAADAVLRRIGMPRTVSTQTLAIGGGAAYPDAAARPGWIDRLARSAGIGRARVETLLERYGARACEIAVASPELGALPAYTRAEIEWLAGSEHVATLADLVLRRTALPFTGELSLAAITELAEVAGGVLGWDGGERLKQVDRLVDQLSTYHGLDRQALAARNPVRKEAHVPDQESSDEPAFRQRQMP